MTSDRLRLEIACALERLGLSDLDEALIARAERLSATAQAAIGQLPRSTSKGLEPAHVLKLPVERK